jgi:hypothetical protein
MHWPTFEQCIHKMLWMVMQLLGSQCTVQRRQLRRGQHWLKGICCYEEINQSGNCLIAMLMQRFDETNSQLQGLSLSQWWWGFRYSGIWCCVVGQVVPDGLKDHRAAVFIGQAVQDVDCFFWNTRNHSLDTVSHARRLECSFTVALNIWMHIIFCALGWW